MKKSLSFFIFTVALLQGCQSNPNRSEPVSLEPVTYTPGEFNRESLYDLMLAELAGQRRMFPIALEKYLHQTEKTRDPLIAERATRIAQYLRDSEKTLLAARLWREIAADNPEPYQIEANILLHKKQYDAALPLVRKALEYDALRTLALIRTQSDQIDSTTQAEYIEMLQSYSSEQPPRADLELTLALLYKAAGREQLALSAFNRALDIEPNNPEALIQKAELLRSDNDINGALDLIQTAFEQQPENRQLHILYTQLLFQAEQSKKGVMQAETLLQKNIKDHQLTYYLALLLLENEAPESAKTAFRRLLELKPQDSSPHFYLGHIAQAEGEKTLALEHYTAVRNGSNILQALSRAAGLLKAPEDKQQVHLILAEARSELPKQAPNIFTLEAEWLDLHDYREEALSLLEEALEQYTDNTTLLYTRAMLVESTDFPQAERDLQRILQLEPENATVQNALGYTLLLHTERYSEAYELIQAALNQEPEDPAILDSMGWVLFKMGRAQEALPYLEKAHNLYADPEVSSHLIQAYWATDQKERARGLLKRSLETSPDSPFLEEAAQFLESK